jgi:hypothetical protein
MLARELGTAPARAGLGVLWRHGLCRVQKVAQRLEPLIRGARLVQRDLSANKPFKRHSVHGHAP